MCLSPNATCVAKRSVPRSTVTALDGGRSSTCPAPNWPSLFLPQHFRVPSLDIEHKCEMIRPDHKWPHQNQCLGGWFPSLHFHLPTAQEASGSRHCPNISRLPVETRDAKYSLPAIDLAMAARNLSGSVEHHGTHSETTNQKQTKTHHYHPDIILLGA